MSSSNVSSVTNHFSTANEGFITTTSGTVSSGATTVGLNSVSGLTNGTIFVGIIEPGVEAKEQTFTGVVDTAGTQITGVKWTRGSNTAHSAGSTVVDYVSGTGHNMMTKGLLVEHDQDGTHSDITATSLEVDGQTWANLLLGWQTVSDSWSYASGTGTNVGTITVPSDATATYQAGMKLKFTQTTVKYAIITKVEATTLTIYMGTDYTIANAAISAISVSNVKAPFGFPLDPAKWSIVATSTSSSSQSSPVTGTLYNLGGSIAIPIGVWRVSYLAHLLHASSSTAFIQSFAGLGTTSSSVIDATLCSSPVVSAAMTEVNGPVSFSNLVTLTSPTTYYLNARRSIGSGGSIQIRGDLRTTILSAECAYL